MQSQLIDYLLSDSAITDITGQKIWQTRARQGKPAPYVLVVYINGSAYEFLDSADCFSIVAQVRAVADNKAAAEELSGKIYDRLRPLTGSLGNFEVQEISTFGPAIPATYPAGDKSDRRQFAYEQDFQIIYE